MDATATSTKPTSYDPTLAIARELSLQPRNVASVVELLATGATVPFIARYRKEATGGLDEVQIRTIEERRSYLLELEERRQTVIAEITKQGKLTPALETKIRSCPTKAELEDLYLPFKPKRRTRASIAQERGLQPLADRIWAQPLEGQPRAEAEKFMDPARGVDNVDAALAGARDICAELIAENADARKYVREAISARGVIRVQKTKEHEAAVTKFDMYAQFEEPIAKIPSHRFLAIRRGEKEGFLKVDIELEERLVPQVAHLAGLNSASPWARELETATSDAYDRLIVPGARIDLRVELKLNSDRGAIQVFAQNLQELLLAPPFGSRPVLGVDPGQRTGCKCAVVAETSAVLEHDVFYLVQGDEATARAKLVLGRLVKQHQVAAVAVGNGTHGRETEAFVRETLAEMGLDSVLVVAVSEAGASVYSASDIAREEFPDLDLTVRGAISIARRLQDPLAELVKVDPKSIGVGQYQHDVHQPLLAKKLDEVVETCVNQVGVELNTASAPLLSRVAGVGPTLAKRIVDHRARAGNFSSRKSLLDVAGLGPRTFEQAAGFLRVRGGAHPLDASAVHPERYPLVEQMAKDLGVPVASLIGNAQAIARIEPEKYFAGEVGAFTINDILDELKKPGRDPRSMFEPPKFRDDVRKLEDLKPGMMLEGVVTNVTAFGAFVDIGVHQDGLVHVSKLSERFIKDPSEVAHVGDRLQVRVLEIDLARKRISLSARKDDEIKPQKFQPEAARQNQRPKRDNVRTENKFTNNPFEALRRR
jgi:protein Tex